MNSLAKQNVSLWLQNFVQCCCIFVRPATQATELHVCCIVDIVGAVLEEDPMVCGDGYTEVCSVDFLFDCDTSPTA